MAATRPSPHSLRRVLLALVAAAVILTASPRLRAASGGEVENEVVVVVSKESPVTELSRLQLGDLYLGRTSRFPDGEPAEPIDQESGSLVRVRFYERYLGRSQAEIKAHWSKIIFTGRGRPPKAVPGSAEVKELVANDPGAIGYIERDLVDDGLRVVRVE